jgi:hypothetical protein
MNERWPSRCAKSHRGDSGASPGVPANRAVPCCFSNCPRRRRSLPERVGVRTDDAGVTVAQTAGRSTAIGRQAAWRTALQRRSPLRFPPSPRRSHDRRPWAEGSYYGGRDQDSKRRYEWKGNLPARRSASVHRRSVFNCPARRTARCLVSRARAVPLPTRRAKRQPASGCAVSAPEGSCNPRSRDRAAAKSSRPAQHVQCKSVEHVRGGG